MLRIIDRYLLTEVLKVFLAVLGVLTLVIVSMLLLRVLEEASLGALSANLVLRFLALEVAREISSLLPPAFFLAVLVAYGRLSRDSELVALHAGGIGAVQLYRPLLYLALPLAIATAWSALFVKPWAVAEIQGIRAHQQHQGFQIAGLQAGRFYQQFDGRVTLYIGEIDDRRRLRQIFIHDRRGDVERLVVSEEGYHRIDDETGDHVVTLLNGRRYDGRPGDAAYGLGEFASYRVWIEARTIEPRGHRRASKSTWELLQSDDRADRAELGNRLAGPLAIFTLALIAVPLSASSPRQRGTGRLLLAFLTYFSFFNLQRLAENWLQRGVTPMWLGSLWYQLLIVAIIALVLAADSYWLRRVRHRLGVG